MESLNKVIQTLEAMVAAHSHLLSLAKEKRKLLVEGDIQGLQNLIQLEGKWADEIQKLEERRINQVQAFMMEKGYAGDSHSLEDLLSVQNDSGSRQTLHSIAKQLRALVQEIAAFNESNQQLIQTSISYIQYSIGLLVRNEPAIGYGPNAAKRYANLLDAKI